MDQDQREIQALFETRVAPIFEKKSNELQKLGQQERDLADYLAGLNVD